MRTLFVNSMRFVKTQDGNVYSNCGYPYSCWSRYLKHFDEITVICRMSDCIEIPERWNLSSGPRVAFAGTPDDHGKPLMQLQNRLSLRIIQQEMEDCDAVIVRQSSLGWLAVREAQRRKVPWAVEVVGDAWDAYWNYGTLFGKLYAPIAWRNSRYWVGKAQFAIYVTREYLQQKYPCPGIRSFASNVEINSVAESALKEKIKCILSSEPDSEKPVMIGLIGSLFNHNKGLNVALRALGRLSREGLFFKLRVLGDGYLDVWREKARQLGVTDLICLDGSLPSGEPVMQWLDGLDIYMQPSFQEGLPRALIEAMSRGLPALGSTCGGIPELLPPECLHQPGDDRTLALQLRRMAQDKDWRVQQAERNYKEAQEYYRNKIEARRDAFWGQFAEYARERIR